MSKKVYEIDGNNFSTLEEFWEEISRVLIPDVYWGKNLDAFNDILRGGFGTPEEGFILVWKNSSVSKDRLGFDETIRQLEKRLQHCHPTNREYVRLQLEQAKQHKFPTVVEWLIEIIEYEEHSDIDLRLE
jgi:RNAse (barnase) inhibitor barstar